MNSSVIVEKEKGIASIFLNEPESSNSLSQKIKEGLMDALVELEADQETKAIILSGKGKVFCGGGDLRTMGPEISSIEMKERMDITTKIFLQIYNMNKPVIAAVQGYAVGAGFSLALAADILFAEEDAKFGLVFNKVGLIPDAGAHYFIKKVVGPWKAKELIWTGAMITAEEGERLGFVNRVVPKGESYESAYKFATEIATGPVNAFRYTKSIINSE